MPLLHHTVKSKQLLKSKPSDVAVLSESEDDHFYSSHGKKRSWDLDDFDLLMSELRHRRNARKLGHHRRRRKQYSSDTESDNDVSPSTKRVADNQEHQGSQRLSAGARTAVSSAGQMSSALSNGVSTATLRVAAKPPTSIAQESARSLSDVVPVSPVLQFSTSDVSLVVSPAIVHSRVTAQSSDLLLKNADQSAVGVVDGAYARDTDVVKGLVVDTSAPFVKLDSGHNSATSGRDQSDAYSAVYSTNGSIATDVPNSDLKAAMSLFANSTFTGTVSKQLSAHIARLLYELDLVKDQNIELRDKLLNAEEEIELIKQLCRGIHANNIQITNSHSALTLVNELCIRHRKREQDVTQHLDYVEAERDKLLHQMEYLELQFQKLQQEKSVSEVRDHLPSDVPDATGKDCKCIHCSVLNENLMSDNTSLRNKCIGLQDELSRLKSNEATVDEKLAIFEKRQVLAEDERDLALARISKLEEELQAIKLSYSLQNSLSQEAALRDELAITRAEHEWFKSQYSAQLAELQEEKTHIASAVSDLTDKNRSLSDELSSSQIALKQLQDENGRLSRLVTVLQRKLNNIGSEVNVAHSE